MKTSDDKLKQITDFFGVETELTKLSEEMGELLNECYKNYLSKTNNTDKVEDEFADVLVILTQLMVYFDVNMDNISEIIDYKVERTLDRINNGWYERHR